MAMTYTPHAADRDAARERSGPAIAALEAARAAAWLHGSYDDHLNARKEIERLRRARHAYVAALQHGVRGPATYFVL
jgi:hypothetical protein